MTQTRGGSALPRAGASDQLIEAVGLRKEFGSCAAVDGIDVAVARGEAFGFLGPNGAGESCTMRMIGGVSPPSGGSLRILGLDRPAARGVPAAVGMAATTWIRSFQDFDYLQMSLVPLTLAVGHLLPGAGLSRRTAVGGADLAAAPRGGD